MPQNRHAHAWEPEWDEEPETRRRRRAPWLPSTRLLVLALGLWVASVVLLVLGFFGGNAGSNQAVLAFFLVCMVVAVIASSLASLLALFGLFKYRRRKIVNLLLLVVSVATNPMVILGVAVSALT